MKKFMIAFAATTMLAGAAYAQSSSTGASDVPATDANDASSSTPAPATTEGMAPGGMAPAGAGTAPAEGTMASGGAMASGSGESVEVGGAPMYANMTIAENAPNASNLSTLVAAVTAAGLVETLDGDGPFTVFAPDNAAFEALPAGTVDTLLEEGNRDQLTSILTYHVVPAEATSEAAMQMIEDDGGTHDVTTVEGGTLTLQMDGDNLTVTDEQGNVATVTQADVMQSNGVVHVIDTVLMPAS